MIFGNRFAATGTKSLPLFMVIAIEKSAMVKVLSATYSVFSRTVSRRVSPWMKESALSFATTRAPPFMIDS